MDSLGHGQDLLPAWLAVRSHFGVLLVVLYQLVVGIGSYSEPAHGATNFSRHTYLVRVSETG